MKRYLPWLGAAAVMLCWLGYMWAQDWKAPEAPSKEIRLSLNSFILKGEPPLNRQCPVCGTMAEAYKVDMFYCDGEECFPPKARITRCARCNNAFWIDAEASK